MQYLKADTITEVTVGPAVAVGDGFTPVTNLVGSAADEFEIIKHGATTTTTIAGTLAAITGADGYYALDLSATDTNTEGRLTLLINDDTLILPIRLEFMVVNANVFDSLFAVSGTDVLDINVAQWLGTAAATPTVAGVPEVDITHQGGGAIPVPAVTGVPDVNLTHHVDVAASVTTGDLDVNVVTLAANSIASGTIAAAELTNIENEIWDALKSAHVVANSFGDFLDVEVSGAAKANVCTEARLSELDAATGGKMANQVDIIEVDTTSLNDTKIPDTLSLVNIQGEVDTALASINLDHLVSIAVDTDWETTVHLDSVIGYLASDGFGTGTGTGTGDGFDRTFHSLEMLREKMKDVLDTDTFTLPGQVAPPLAPTLEEAIGWLYKTFRNKKEQTTTEWRLYDDAGSTVDSKATVSDAASIATKEEIAAGP